MAELSSKRKVGRNLLLGGVLAVVFVVSIAFVFSVSQGKFKKEREIAEREKKIEEYSQAPEGKPQEIAEILTKAENDKKIEAEKQKKASAGLAPPSPPGKEVSVDELEPPVMKGGNSAPGKISETGDVKIKGEFSAPAMTKGGVFPEIYENYGNAVTQTAQTIQSQLQQTSASQSQGQQHAPASTKNQVANASDNSLEKTGAVRPGIAPSRRWLREGAVIDVVLMNGINTQNAGQIQLRTVTDVYDSVGDRRLLIPKGSTLLGVFGQPVSQSGLDRIPIAVHRIIFSDGRSIKLANNPIGDVQGYTGAPAEFHSNLLRAIGPSALVAWIGYKLDQSMSQKQVAQPSGQGGYGSSRPPNISEQIIPKIEQRVAERYGSAKPYYTIEPGIRLSMTLAEDLEIPYFEEK